MDMSHMRRFFAKKVICEDRVFNPAPLMSISAETPQVTT